MKAIGNVIINFKDKVKLSAALKDLQAAHYPIPLNNKELTAQHFRVSNFWFQLLTAGNLPSESGSSNAERLAERNLEEKNMIVTAGAAEPHSPRGFC